MPGVTIDVVPRAEDVASDAVRAAAVLVVDALRASTTIITALANGARAIAPVADADAARERAAREPGSLIAGERRGRQIAGFDLGNSPAQFTPDRVRDRLVILTTSNGTRALLAARQAAAVAIAGFPNVAAASVWARQQARDVIVACAGERGRVSLEDLVCAGFLVEHVLTGLGGAEIRTRALDAVEAARPYRKDLARLAQDSAWARHLAAAGHDEDVRRCLAVDTIPVVPCYLPDVDKVVWGPR